MDDSLVIYSSVFLLVSFVVLYKYLGHSILLSLGVPIGLIVLYNIKMSNGLSLGSSNETMNFEVMTDMPDF